jgi:hypothetical protein
MKGEVPPVQVTETFTVVDWPESRVAGIGVETAPLSAGFTLNWTTEVCTVCGGTVLSFTTAQ